MTESKIHPNKINHIGVAIHSLENALPFYRDILGLTLEKIEEVPSEQVKVAFFTIGETKIELLEPLSEQSPIHSFLEKRGEGIHHIALEVDEIDEKLELLKENEVQLIHEQAKEGANNTKIAFIHPKASNKVLLELVEEHRKEEA